MGKTRDLIKRIRDTKGTFPENMGTIKDRNGMDLTEAEDYHQVGEKMPSVTSYQGNANQNHSELLPHT